MPGIENVRRCPVKPFPVTYTNKRQPRRVLARQGVKLHQLPTSRPKSRLQLR